MTGIEQNSLYNFPYLLAHEGTSTSFHDLLYMETKAGALVSEWISSINQNPALVLAKKKYRDDDESQNGEDGNLEEKELEGDDDQDEDDGEDGGDDHEPDDSDDEDDADVETDGGEDEFDDDSDEDESDEDDEDDEYDLDEDDDEDDDDQ